MIEILLDFLFSNLFGYIFSSSSYTSSKKTKVFHAILRTSMYLVFIALFIFLSVVSEHAERIIYGLISFVFFVGMVRTNWRSYQRHKEWTTKKLLRAKTENTK